jgi:hypothetical protein
MQDTRHTPFAHIVPLKVLDLNISQAFIHEPSGLQDTIDTTWWPSFFWES